MATIALLEDEQDLREEVAAFLSGRGFRVLQAGSLAEFSTLAGQARVAVVDVMLPDGSGLDAVRMMRQASPRTGIVMLTALGSLDERVAGLGAGADHYLVKPFRLPELEAVLVALLRRVGRDWVFDGTRNSLISPDNHTLELSPQEAALMGLVARSSGGAVHRRQIVEALGHSWSTYDMRRLDTLVSRLRSRWQQETGQELPLKTLHREGYTFVEPIEAPLARPAAP